MLVFTLKKLILIRNGLHTFINRDFYAETVTKQFTYNIRHFVLPQTCMIAGGRVSGFFGRILYFASISADMNSTPIQSIHFRIRIQNSQIRDETRLSLFGIHASACKRQNDGQY